MKVVCKKIPPTFISISLEVGRVYDAYSVKIGKPVDDRKGYSTYWYVKDSDGNVIPCEPDMEKYFVSLDKWRQQKLTEILQ